MKARLFVLAAAVALAACGEGSEKSANNGANNTTANNTTANNTTANNTTANNTTANNTNAAVTYYEHIKPVVDAKCVECHTPGAIGPFPLRDYDEVFAVRELVKSAVTQKAMPPYIYDTKCREYVHDPTISDEQIDLITAWVDAGAPAGDPTNEGAPLEIAIPEPPVFDTTAEMAEPYTPTRSPDDYRCFVVDWPHQTRKYVTGYGVEPGEDGIVHHVIGFLASPNSAAEAVAKDEAEAGPGYTCFGTANISEQSWMGSWAPGGLPVEFPEGTGIPVEPGSKMIIQVHYNTLTEEPRPDVTKIHFETADTVETEAMWMPWANPVWLNGNMRIAAGDADASHSFAYDPTGFLSNGQPIKIWGGGLHMHMLGKSIRASIIRSNGDDECLVESPRWDFNWQTGAQFAEPAVLNPGDRLSLECHWDNSAANQPVIDGERQMPADRNWGEGTRDEMCLGVFYMTM